MIEKQRLAQLTGVSGDQAIGAESYDEGKQTIGKQVSVQRIYDL